MFSDTLVQTQRNSPPVFDIIDHLHLLRDEQHLSHQLHFSGLKEPD